MEGNESGIAFAAFTAQGYFAFFYFLSLHYSNQVEGLRTACYFQMLELLLFCS